MNEKGIHEGHRKRVKAAFLAGGIDGLSDHQVLEILLFYSIPAKDTNPLAHILMERFGSLRGVLEAGADELLKIEGVSEHTVSLIKFTQLISGRYLREASFEDCSELRFKGTDALIDYYESVFLGKNDEQVYMTALDDELRIADEKILSGGTAGTIEFNARVVVDFALRSKCGRIALAHNHPNGAAMPSRSDVASTSKIVSLLKEFGIELLDHIIIGRTGSCSMRTSGVGKEIWKEEE